MSIHFQLLLNSRLEKQSPLVEHVFYELSAIMGGVISESLSTSRTLLLLVNAPKLLCVCSED